MKKTNTGYEVRRTERGEPGTSFQGYLPDGTTYGKLAQVFGQPNREESGDGKVTCCWAGTIDGAPFTIYDYKTDIEAEANTNWHIGGRAKLVANAVLDHFNRAQGKINLKKAPAAKRIASRYLSVKNEGQEVYAEDISKDGLLIDYRVMAQKRLGKIQEAMPVGTWTITVEQQYHPNPNDNSRVYDIMDPTNGKIETITL